MTRRSRIATYIVGGIAALLIAVVIGAILIARTQRFKEFVRTKIISVTEDATGGRVELNSFDFDWRHLRARMTDFVIRGTEPAGSAPLFRARSIELRLKLFSGLKKAVDLQYLGVDQPSANVIVFPDGRTNIPSPKIKKKSDKSGLETVVDLAIHKFEIVNGSAQFAEQKTELNARGQNLRAQLFFNPATSAYKGEIDVDPLYVATGRREPLNVKVNLPVTLGRDRIDLSNARIATAESTVIVNGAVQNMTAPVLTAHLNARVSLPEVKRAVNAPIYPAARGAPSTAEADVNVRMDENTIEISSAHVAVGHTTVEASGMLKDPSQRGALNFYTNLALDELSRLLQVSAQPEGTVQVSGQAKFRDASDYLVTGAILARNLSIRQGTTRVRQINLTSAVKADPHAIDLSGLRLSAFGGELLGNARLEEMERLRFAGRLANFDLQRLAAALGSPHVDYSGTLEGTVQAEGNLKAPGTSGLQAQTQLAIVPGQRGVPVSGRIAARYSGAADTVSIANSYIALPHSKLDVSGALDKRIDLRLVSTNLNDFLPAAALASANPPKEMPVTLNGGAVNIDAQVMGKLASPRIAGHVAVTKFTVEQRAFDQLTADLTASSSGAQVQNGLLARGTLRADFAASVGMRNWSAGPREPLAANAAIRDGDLADIVALAGQKDVPVSGGLNASARISGTLGNPQGDAKITIVNGSAYEEPFDRFDAQVNLSDQLVTLSPVVLTKGASKIDLNGTFRHPRDSFDTGQVQLHVASNAVTLEQFRTLEKQRPGLAGTITISADAAADLLHPDGRSEFAISAVNAKLTARNLRERNQRLGDLTANAQTSGNNVNFRVDSDFAGSNVLVTGVTRLTKDYPTTADASIRDLAIERVLSIARASQIPASGMLSAKAHVAGTVSDPHANVDLALAKAVVYEERIDRAQATVNYTSRSIDIPSLQISSAAGQIDGNVSFSHPQNDFDNGHVQLHLASSGIQLGSIQNVKKTKPGLAGRLRLLVDAAADLRTQGGKQQVLFSKLDADIGATGIELNRKPFGGATFRAVTKDQQLSFQMDSDIANAAIHGNGTAQLSGDYPLDARLTFANVTYSNLQRLTGTAITEARSDFEGLAEGQITANGPVLKPEDMRAVLEISRLQLTTGKGKQVAIQNQGPLRIEMDHSVVNVQSFRVANHLTNFSLAGKVNLKDRSPLNLSVDGNINLSLLQELTPDAYSGGSLVMKAAIRGGFEQPVINGRIDLKNASVNLADAPNGISNANGSILLNGTSAVIQNLTAESGGGKITLSGFVGLTGTTLRYRVRANADRVRSRYSGASVVANADLNLSGTSERSLLAGTVTIQRVSYSSQTDVGSILSQSATPPNTPSAPSGPVAGMRLDIHIRTAPDVRFQTALTTQLQADADLNLVGTLETPGMVGRVNITEGELVFFSNQYTVNRGSIAFYNPLKIEPILQIALETTVKGVDVNLEVSGPIDNMKLAYRSDPPLRFDEIVQLLATGKTPTSDPTIAAHQPEPPPQSVAQMGESAIVSQAVAAPLANRLERVFGINQLKIDPTFTAGSALPQARLTLQQQISGNLTFTYTTDLTQTNREIVRVEWALNPRFSAVATRDENGYFGVDFFYKKQFR